MVYVLLILVFFICLGILGADWEGKKPSSKTGPLLSARAHTITLLIAGVTVILFFIKLNTPKSDPSTDDGSTALLKYQHSILLREIEQAALGSQVVVLDVYVNSTCMWVSIVDDGLNKDELASQFCSIAKRNGASCVNIYDSNLKRLGRSICN